MESVKTHVAFQREDEPALFVYDAKSMSDIQTRTYPTRPWFLLPPLDLPHLQLCVQAGMELFGPADIFACLDGRRPDIGKKFHRLVTSNSKTLVKNGNMQKRIFQPDIRLLYSNEEFISGYAKSARMKSLGYVPEPVESISCATGAKVNLTTRPRRFIDLPGVTFTRSLSGCLLRSAEEHGVKLTQDAAGKLPQNSNADDAGAGEDDQSDKESKEGEEPAAADADDDGDGEPGDEQKDPEQQAGSVWYPWTASEETMLEFLNIFAGDNPKVKVVSWCAGYGQLELACLRSDMTVLSLVQSVTHRQARDAQVK